MFCYDRTELALPLQAPSDTRLARSYHEVAAGRPVRTWLMISPSDGYQAKNSLSDGEKSLSDINMCQRDW